MLQNPKILRFLLIIPLILAVSLLSLGYFTWQKKLGIEQYSGLLPLQADSEHDVVVLEECDLAIKWKKSDLAQYSPLTEEQKKLPLNIPDFNLVPTKSKNIWAGYKIYFNCNILEPYDSYYSALSKDKGYEYNDIPTKTFLGLDSFKNVRICRCFGAITNYKLKLDMPNLNKPIFIYKNSNLDSNISIQVQPNSLAPSTPSVKL